jgi:hypothetical protein
MDLRELVDLIAIRQYVINASGNFAISKTVINTMSDMLLSLDAKILDLLQSDEFKQHIGYQDTRQARIEAAQRNIKSAVKI